MSAAALEAFLAKIYVDGHARARFLADPSGAAQRAGLTCEECDALQKIDREGLLLAVRSFERKRSSMDMRKGRQVRTLHRLALPIIRFGERFRRWFTLQI